MRMSVRMLKAVSAALLLVVLAAGGAAAQRVHTPAAGSPERRLLMDALRLRMQRELNKPMIFRVVQLRVLGEWAFAEVVPLRPDGGPFDYSGTPFARARREGMMDDASVAALHRTGGTWRVVRLAIGPTDVAWWDWDKELHAPRAVFPYP